MNKNIKLALLLSCISTSSIAYQVKAYLTIDNKTNVPMQIIVEQPNKQPTLIQDIPALHTTRVTKSQNDFGAPLENGMSYILSLNQSHAFFTITGIGENKYKLYMQGRINYYAGAGAYDKYSFIDNISAAQGLSFEPSYTCRRATQTDQAFNNQIVIEGTPGNTLDLVPKFDEDGFCQGFKSSSMRDGEGVDQKNQYYTPVCFDGTSSIFWRTMAADHHGFEYPAYYNGNYNNLYGIGGTSPYDPRFKDLVDKWVGNRYCETWPRDGRSGGGGA